MTVIIRMIDLFFWQQLIVYRGGAVAPLRLCPLLGYATVQ